MRMLKWYPHVQAGNTKPAMITFSVAIMLRDGIATRKETIQRFMHCVTLKVVTDFMIDVRMSTCSCHPCSIMILLVCFLVLPSLLNFTIDCVILITTRRRLPSCSLWRVLQHG